MRRILVSILLLLAALFLSKSFSTELPNPIPQTRPLSEIGLGENEVIIQGQFAGPDRSSTGCPCDSPADYPTFTLVLIAAVTASFSMATFIYGSQLIATLVAG
jgi:hypothetical protein